MVDPQKTRYTIKVDSQKVDEVLAYSPRGAAAHAMEELGIETANRIHVISGNGQHVFLYTVRLLGGSWVTVERED